VDTEVVTRPVGAADVADLSSLFGGARSTRHCWCMAFCTTRTQFAAGWLLGGNARRFAALADAGPVPMGVVASVAGKPVGWAACGPRSRYVAAIDPSYPLLAGREPAEDETVWLLPCLFVRADSRGRGLTSTLVEAAVRLARENGAPAVEGWPLADSVGRSADAVVGRERVFTALGFRRVASPRPDRVVVRLELSGPPAGR
jgi:GNAT superfamily N-acetyltransferase